MTKVLEIERAIKELPREDYGRLRRWVEDIEVVYDVWNSSAQISDILDIEDGGESLFSIPFC